MARKLIRDFIPSLSHEADGLILQVWDGMRVWNGGVEHRVHGTRRAWIPAHWPFSPLTIPHECMPFPPLPSPPSPPFPSLPFPPLKDQPRPAPSLPVSMQARLLRACVEAGIGADMTQLDHTIAMHQPPPVRGGAGQGTGRGRAGQG